MKRNVPFTPGLLTLGLGLSALLPFALLIVWSFSGRWYFPSLLPTEWSGRAWSDVLSPGSQLWSALWGSAWVATVSALLGTLLALPASRALTLAPLRRRGLWTALLVLPSFASVMGVQVVFIRLGLADTRAGVVLAHLIPVTPYAVVLLSGVFGGYDPRTEEVARTLGAGRWATWWRVTLPILLPGVLVSLAFAFLVSWSEYLLTLIVGGGQVLTLPLLLFSAAQGGDYALTAALALVFVAPTVLLFAFLSPRLVSRRP